MSTEENFEPFLAGPEGEPDAEQVAKGMEELEKFVENEGGVPADVHFE